MKEQHLDEDVQQTLMGLSLEEAKTSPSIKTSKGKYEDVTKADAEDDILLSAVNSKQVQPRQKIRESDIMNESMMGDITRDSAAHIDSISLNDESPDESHISQLAESIQPDQVITYSKDESVINQQEQSR